MNTSIRQLFLGTVAACFFTLTLTALAQEEKKTSAPPAATEQASAAVAASEPAPTPTATPPAAPAAAEQAKATEAAAPAQPAPAATAPTEEKKSEPQLRRLDEPTKPVGPTRARSPRPPRVRPSSDSGNSRVAIGSDVHLGPGEKSDAVVAIAGSATSEGEVADAVVSIMGNSTVTAGSVGDAVVSVMGNTYVNTKIGGEAVAVMGNVELGPNAEIGGDVVSVGGTVQRDPQAVVRGNVQNVSIAGKFPHLGGLQTWFRECLLWGRPLAFKPGLEWVWLITLGFFAFYVLLALIFGGAVEKCALTLEERPGGSLLATLLTILLTPVLIVLLCVTIVGIVAVPFIIIGLILAALFGKAVMLAWLGRRFTKFFGPGLMSHAAVATLIGAAIVLLVYTVPFLGMTVQKTFDLVGIGVVVYTLLLASKKPKPVAPIAPLAPMPLVPGTPAAAAGFAAGAGGEPPPAASSDAAAGTAASFGAPVVLAATLPRAGFWIRVGALALDGILIGLIAAMTHLGPKFFLLGLATYAAVMWKLKGTTIGGIVCGLKVVRLDGRELDWATAIVRALGCFLSLAVVGLGFIWVAIDDEKQSWHDKIAGTTVVSVPKGVSLL